MQKQSLQNKTIQWIKEALHPISLKMSQQSPEGVTYRDALLQKLDQKVAKAKLKGQSTRAKSHRYLQRLGIHLRDPDDFLTEIRLYLEYNIAALMADGLSETEAAQKTIEYFSEDGDGQTNFDKLINDWSNYYIDQILTYSDDTKKDEAVGLFYAAFFLLFGIGGGLWGYFTDRLIVGLITGILGGLAMGLLIHGIITLVGTRSKP